GPLEFEESSGRASTYSSPGRLLSIDSSLRFCRLVSGELRDPIHVLDLGCGTGGFLGFFRAQLEGFTSYTGVDIEAWPSWSDHASEDARFVQEDAGAFLDRCQRAGEAPFNVVYSNSALEHMRDDDSV